MKQLREINNQELLQELQNRIEYLTTIQEKIAEVKLVNLEIKKEKLVAQLEDGRELSIPINWFVKWGVDNVTAKKLEKYEIWRGKNIFFPEINEVLGIEKFIGGFNAPCQ